MTFLEYYLKEETALPNENSNGNPIAHTEEALKSFWDWFGDSKVVDSQGRPLIVYHGTYAYDFSEFDPDALKHRTGFYFTDNPKMAKHYSSIDMERSRTYLAYLKIETPMVFEGNGKHIRDVVPSNVIKKGDGMIVKDVEDYGGYSINDWEPEGTVYVVYKANQIKSAIGNNGNFNPNSNNITEAMSKSQFPSKMSSSEIRDMLTSKGKDAYGKLSYEDVKNTTFGTYILTNVRVADLPKINVDINYKNKSKFPPVVNFNNGEYEVVDGKHRISMAHKRGEEYIECYVSTF